MGDRESHGLPQERKGQQQLQLLVESPEGV